MQVEFDSSSTEFYHFWPFSTKFSSKFPNVHLENQLSRQAPCPDNSYSSYGPRRVFGGTGDPLEDPVYPLEDPADLVEDPGDLVEDPGVPNSYSKI